MRKFAEVVPKGTSENNLFVHNSTLNVSDIITSYVLNEACYVSGNYWQFIWW